MNSNPTTLIVDEQIDKLVISLIADGTNTWMPPTYDDLSERIKSLIRQVCEEVLPDRCDDTRGNKQNPNNTKYSTKYAKGWNDCISEQRTKLNNLLGNDK